MGHDIVRLLFVFFAHKFVLCLFIFSPVLAVTELLLHHANTTLRYISRLDFSIASKEGKQFKSYKLGFTSHGALALAKVLQTTKYIHQVWLPGHRIGPYGASAIFLACQENPTIQTLNMRRCRIGERGAFAFCESLSSTKTRGLSDVDLSSNGLGHRGTVSIQRLLERQNTDVPPLFVNLEGNLVFPEIMNGITHGLGVILSILGGHLVSKRVEGLSHTHMISCTIYTTSLLVLYTSSTLFHSFFALQHTKYIFQVFDKCAIYILIAGSYTPFLQILLSDQPIFSVGLLGFIWACGFFGIYVEAFCPTWKYRPTFSLAMYLGMGWACMVCLPALKDRLAKGCIYLIFLGGVGYTSGVPFFVRNNNLDHAIWHLFVLTGSILHWMAVYIYVAPMPLVHESTSLEA
jgi:hemolysin III